jgi:site-specific recombinase XerD
MRVTNWCTLKWLWERYHETTVWTELSMATRRQRENIMRHVLEQSADVRAADIKRKHIVAGRDRRKPSQGRHFLMTLRHMFKRAVDAGHVKADPTADVENPK